MHSDFIDEDFNVSLEDKKIYENMTPYERSTNNISLNQINEVDSN